MINSEALRIGVIAFFAGVACVFLVLAWINGELL